MRVVTLEELGACPAGTIFSDYEPCIVKELYRLGEVIRYDGDSDQHHKKGQVTDFFYLSLLAEPGDEAYLKAGDDPRKGWTLAGGWSRWGCFEMDALFVVYEPDDVKTLVELLTAPTREISKIPESGYKKEWGE